MNKLFTTIAVASLSLTMAVGVGVAVSQSAKSAERANASISTATMQYTGSTNTTANADCTSQFGLDSTLFTASYTKGTTSSNMALRTDGVRMYANAKATGNSISVTAATGLTIQKINIAFDSASYATHAVVKAGSDTVTGSNYEYIINGSNFSLTDVNTANSAQQVRFQSITITYDDGSGSTTHTVSFDANGGSSTMSDVTADEGNYTLPANGFTAPSGKQFACWKIGDENVYKPAGATITLTSDITLTAEWIKSSVSAANPYTVQEAHYAIFGNVGVTSVFVKGSVSYVDYVTNGKLVYFISDDGNRTNELEVYKGLGLNSATFSAKTDLPVGDVVVVTGDLISHNNTHEFSEGNYLSSHTGVTAISVNTAPTKVAYDTDEYFDPTGLVISASYSTEKTVQVAYSGHESDFTFSPTLDTKLSNESSVSITYHNQSTTQAITVTARTVTAVTLEGDMTKKSYYVNNDWNYSGLYLTVTYSSGSPATVQLSTLTAGTDFTANPAKANSTSVTQVAISGTYEGKPFSKTVTGITVAEHGNFDYITYDMLNAAGAIGSGTGYGTASIVTDYTDAQYTARSMAPSSGNAMKFADNANGYLYTSTAPTGRTIKSITLASVTSGKTIGVYASNTAFTACPEDKSAAIGTISSSSLTYTFEANYTCFAIRSHTSSTEIGAITIEYQAPQPTVILSSTNVTAQIGSLNESISVSTEFFSGTPTITAAASSNTSLFDDVHYANGKVVFVTGTTIGMAGILVTATYNSESATALLNVTITKADEFISYNAGEASWDLVTNPSTLSAGDQVIVTGVKNDDVLAMGTYSSGNNVKAVVSSPLTITNNKITSGITNEMIYTLENGSETGSLAFKDSTGKYLYAAASNSNNMKSQSSIDENASFTIGSDSTVVATESSNRNNMRFNANGSNDAIFSCYASDSTTGVTVTFYKLNGGVQKVLIDDDLYEVMEYVNVSFQCDRSGATFDSEGWSDASEAFTSAIQSKYHLSAAIADANGNSVEKFLADYDYVVIKYGSQYDFLSRNPSAQGLVNHSIFNAIGTEATTAIIVVVALTSVTAISAIFFIKRRKYN